MTLVEKRTTETTPLVEGRTPSQVGWFVLGLVALAVIAIVIGVAMSVNTEPEVTDSARSAAEVPIQTAFTSEELIMMELAAKGYIPMQAVDWEAMALRQAVADGYVPEQALRPYFAEGNEPLFTAEELTTIELAEKGLIPMQTVDWEEVELKRLANKGLIPWPAAP